MFQWWPAEWHAHGARAGIWDGQSAEKAKCRPEYKMSAVLRLYNDSRSSGARHGTTYPSGPPPPSDFHIQSRRLLSPAWNDLGDPRINRGRDGRLTDDSGERPRGNT